MATSPKPELLSFKIAGVTAFGSYPDMARTCLDQAYALMSMLSAGEECAEAAGSEQDELSALGPPLKARGYEGIQTLIALAQFAIEQDGRCVA